MEEKHYDNWGEDIFPSPVKYWGIKVDKERDGDFSVGACITRDGCMDEFYLYINLIKWSISIGRLTKTEG